MMVSAGRLLDSALQQVQGTAKATKEQHKLEKEAGNELVVLT